jgi:hypothetical protein
MPNWAAPPGFIGYPGLTYEQSLAVQWAIQNGTPLPSYAPNEVQQTRAQEELRKKKKPHVYDGGRRMKYKSTRRRGKSTRRRVKTHRRRHRKH